MAEPIDFFPITTEQTDWQTSGDILRDIRHRVFVNEQQVPEDLELDGRDPEALHWVAWGENDHPMGTARLLGNKIGRMAVLSHYRARGVGSSLLRAIINHAIRSGLTTLVLDAQQQAVPFYRDNGFEVVGEEFMDAGIPHYPMAMDLDRYLHRRQAPPPPAVSDESRQRIALDSSEQFALRALETVRNCDRSLRIFSDHLDPLLYDNEAFCQGVFQLATRHPNAKIHFLVRDSQWLTNNFHRLLETYHRLLSHIQLRRLNQERETLHTEFMVGDLDMVLYNQDPDRYRGYFYRYAPAEARRLILDFDSLWESSLPDPEVRRLYL